MTWPSHVQVGPYRYALVVSEKAIGRARKIEQDQRVGSLDASGQRIIVDPGLGPDQQADTVLHELLHAVWQLVGLNHGPAGEHEELVVVSLAPNLLDALRRNPDLVAALLAG